MTTIRFELKKERLLIGRAWVIDPAGAAVLGPWPCLGKADGAAAKAHGNPTRDPKLPWGDTPTGTFSIVSLVRHANTEQDVHSYGPSKSLLLAGLIGDAALRDPEKHLDGIECHGGDPSPIGGLRPTHGCLRSSNEDQAKLIALVESLGAENCRVEVTEVEVK
jgi:hypothetical protein